MLLALLCLTSLLPFSADFHVDLSYDGRMTKEGEPAPERQPRKKEKSNITIRREIFDRMIQRTIDQRYEQGQPPPPLSADLLKGVDQWPAKEMQKTSDKQLRKLIAQEIAKQRPRNVTQHEEPPPPPKTAKDNLDK